MTQELAHSPISQRIGLFGGTFNPIHYGHLRAAEEICEHFRMSKIIFVPAHIPPHKNGEVLTAPEHRLRMVRLAIEGNSLFAASDFEITQERTSYSILTVEHFRNQHGPRMELFFLVGIDSFLEITTWKEYVRLFSLTNLVIMSRPGFLERDPLSALPVDVAQKFDYNPDHRFFEHPSGHRLYFHQITLLEISSSGIRQRIKERQSVRYLLPAEVEAYIGKHGLFQK